MVQTVYRGKWETLGKELEDIIRQNNKKSKDDKKPLNKLFEDFAETHDTTYNSASRYYYNEIKPRIEEEPKKETINIDESIENFTRSVTTELRDPRSVYHIGDTIDVTVTSIQDYGVFAKTDEGFEGLIHISEITGSQYVELPEDFFYIGERVKVKIKRIDTNKKMNFSTRALGGKDKINPAFVDIAKTNAVKTGHVINTAKVSEPKTVKVESKVLEPKVTEPKVDIPKVEQPKEEPKQPIQNNDRDNIITFIKKYSDNNVSMQALADIDDMVAKYGVFQTTISLMEAVRDLDISSFITRITKEKLAGEYLRRL